VVFQKKTEMPPPFDVAGIENAPGHGSGAIIGMAGNADGTAAKAFDLIVAVLRLYIDEGARREACAIDELG